MTDEQFLLIKQEFDEVAALRENLASTQKRCNDLLTENRKLKVENARLKLVQEEVNELRGAMLLRSE